ncbi:11928_t:CDS:2 [Funneliformis geosporum]|nr:11928_t:CDS:2 [Funneliformis geosporum]
MSKPKDPRFRDKATEDFYSGERVLRFQELGRSEKQEARQKIGDKGQHSIRLSVWQVKLNIMVRDKDLHPIHPGEILREELLKTYQITPQQLAQSIKVEENIVKEIVKEQRDITPELSYRLDLQKHYELECWKEQQELKKIVKQVQPISLGKRAEA